MPEHEMQAAEIHELALEAEVANDKPKDPDQLNPGLAFAAPRGGAAANEKVDDSRRDSETAFSETPDEEEPTEQEKQTLRRIGETLPVAAWLVAIIELSERFTFYGCQGLFQNYVQRPLDGSLGRGALGRGHQTATALTTFFSLWCYVTPILGAVVADQYLGKYKTLIVFACVYIVGLLILVLTSLPVALEHGAGMGGFVAAILIIGIGTGGIKANVAPLIADQYQRKKMAIKTIVKTGERVIIDPAVTIQRIYLIFYCCINIGALSLLATPYMERDIGFWSAFLLCLCMFVVGLTALVLGRKQYIVRPPQGSIITDAFKAIWIMFKYRNMNAPKPSYQEEFGRKHPTPWDDLFIDELKRALQACKVFVFYPIYWAVYSQFSGNFVSQAAQMNGHGIPNDLMQNFDPIAILVFAALIDRVLYPAFRKYGIKFRPISRITFGFLIASMSMLYAAVLQHFIYKTGPCFGSPLKCEAAKVAGTNTLLPNNIHIAIQTPAYIFIGISEIFASVTGLEYAYMKAPPSMKSFVQAMYLLTNAVGYAISEAFIPLVGDPKIMYLFTGLCAGSFVVGVVFWVVFHKYDALEDQNNAMDAKHQDLENKRAINSTGMDEESGRDVRRVNKREG
ncbi:probable peptide transporter PTR2-A [Rhynchosporium secalis]|uniref:Probable peptide transporter PTR2-A n=1 Tax=Rhynchosporium secalis TaxID=38038 RepID=A0A1E1LY48_RHYSE|nr:probable peptide transporter PTR2-A [Rhynchosporium secalis]